MLTCFGHIDTDPVNQPQPLNQNIPQYVRAVRDGPDQQHYQEDEVRAVREDPARARLRHR